MRITAPRSTCITEATGTITLTVMTVEVGGRVYHVGPPKRDGAGPRFGCDTYADVRLGSEVTAAQRHTPPTGWAS